MESFIHNWGYLALFLYSFGGGMLALAIASVFAFTGELNIYYVIIIAIIANFIGDQFLFTMARNNKNQAKQMMQKHKRKIAMAYLMMRKYGSWAILFQKYIYGIKTLIPLVIGLTKFDTKKFMLFNFIGAVIWALIVGMSAYFLGNVVLNSLEEFKTYGIVFLVIIILSISIWLKK